MKRYILLLLLFVSFKLFSSGLTFGGRKDETGKIFMFTRPLHHNIAAIQSLWHNFVYNKERERQGHGQLIGLYQESFMNKRTARYFLFCCDTTQLEVRGDNTPDSCFRNIRAEWLGINNPDFRGTLTIDPKQKQFGVIGEYHLSLDFIDLSFFQDAWINILAPVVVVENNLNFCQFDIHNTGTQCPRDLIQAFNQRCWRYGKMSPNTKTELGVSNLDIRFGRTYLGENNFEVVYYSGFSVPTSGHASPEFIFNPYLGNNGHFGFIVGVAFQIEVSREDSWFKSCWYLNLENLFLIRNKQLRTFDLKCKPWSRYLLLNRKCGPPDQNIPGVNVLTCQVRTRPYDIVEFATGFRVKSDRMELEIGYGLWGHGDEKLRFELPFEPIYGIAGKGPLCPDSDCPRASSASCSTICCQASNDVDSDGNPIFVPICQSDIDLRSGAAKSAINHRVHVAAGFTHYGKRMDGFMGIGTFFEFPQLNTALKLWGAWLKVGASI